MVAIPKSGEQGISLGGLLIILHLLFSKFFCPLLVLENLGLFESGNLTKYRFWVLREGKSTKYYLYKSSNSGSSIIATTRIDILNLILITDQ